jgi:hypothetical protein
MHHRTLVWHVYNVFVSIKMKKSSKIKKSKYFIWRESLGTYCNGLVLTVCCRS